MKKLVIAIVSFFVFCGIGAQNKELNIGDKAPVFSAKADNGKVWKSKKYIGKKNIVVYFYPAAMTGGCTKQACAYRDDEENLNTADAIVIGISGDEVENLELFKKANQLNFSLLSDIDGAIAQSFGVPIKQGEKTIQREFEGVQFDLTRNLTTARWTFVIDKKGKIVYKSTQVNAAADSEEVLKVLNSL
ncbi:MULTISPECIES: peroxiredoxin [unclassified Saccharicrinis]|uniref:peroxiredoxin n=1 Tax=unclassified Saccharicrinis TaxID=2646859 RepID=UPI003D35936C